MGHSNDLHINSLSRAFETAFDWAVAADRRGDTDDIAGSFADLVASALQDVRLTTIPTIDAQQPVLPMFTEHRIRTDLFDVLRSGLGGGPAVDILLQLWFDTEDTVAEWGIPLLFRRISKAGRMSDLDWFELRQQCRDMAHLSPCSRVVFVAEEGHFDWYARSGWNGRQTILACDAAMIGGSRAPPNPVVGRSVAAFSLDLASGWIGDPALSGRGPDRTLTDFLSIFHVQRVLRLRIECVNPGEVFAPQPLPF